MPSRGEAVAERARVLLGTRFRAMGRMPASGLDCVGLAAHAAAIDAADTAIGYSLRGTSLAMLKRELDRLGFVGVAENAAQAGDLLAFAPGPRQLHLGICTGPTLIHADAGAGRVVERPLPAPWPLLGVWRLGQLPDGESK